MKTDDSRIRGTRATRAGFEIAPTAMRAWRDLPRSVQRHIETFICRDYRPEDHRRPGVFVSLLPAPATSTPNDLAEIAAGLSIAFPQLIRRVTDVAISGHIRVRLECEGTHEGIWQGIVCPTGQRVAFKEQHEIVITRRRVMSDWVTLDVENILLQMGAGPSVIHVAL